MATITKAQLATRVLQRLTILAAGESPSAADSALVEARIDTAYARLRKLALLDFTSSILSTAIPDWAQDSLEQFVAAEVAPHFGKALNKEAEQMAARRELQNQMAGRRHTRTHPDYY